MNCTHEIDINNIGYNLKTNKKDYYCKKCEELILSTELTSEDKKQLKQLEKQLTKYNAEKKK